MRRVRRAWTALASGKGQEQAPRLRERERERKEEEEEEGAGFETSKSGRESNKFDIYVIWESRIWHCHFGEEEDS